MSETPLLSIRDLQIDFPNQSGAVRAVDGVNLDLYQGETLAIVGESGSGKSTTAHAIINLLPGTGKISGGSIVFDGKELVGMSDHELESIRGNQIGFVPQDPMSNLNPVWSIGFQVEEAVRANGIATEKKAVRAAAIDVLRKAGLSDAEARLRQFPHQFSGGMRQRVLIGIGLAANPKLLIADEPTSALDVTVQRTILDHLTELTHQSDTSVILITHDLGLAAERAEKLVVMYRGKVVESGPSLEVLRNPKHPYTKRLVAAAPSLASRRLSSGGSAAVNEFDLSAVAKERIARVKAGETAVSVKDLTKIYAIKGQGFKSTPFTAVDSVSFEIKRGTTLALVGESGSGKSTVAKMLLGLEKPTSGDIVIDGQHVGELKAKALFKLRSKMQPVFQDPYGSLDPLMNIANIIAEPLLTHGIGDRASRNQRVAELLDQVALPAALATRYPNELSGGQRQRVAIARALALKPEIVVLDEAVSALDVLVQAQILELLAGLQAEMGLTYLFITHDLAVVRVIADQVAVMNKGQIVEFGSTDDIFNRPQQDYTRNLLDAIPGAKLLL
ncbi:dipeptide ABC transporter ATP-binding protein [Candidatus Rhodoluna planktonica]|uniref:ABC transporter ATP-binding protein n=1 Tax=Candidatus Rhodoluna planktonica TaxID=535712 RepID=A0A1D9DXW0_9MICO|nr:ABC transporter ATP-binding protein [Candidatus Rhodoluna planktonica]AOY55644.1 ABC transporter ATP-binding protein [Candidatus Rhodoluna planktonica]